MKQTAKAVREVLYRGEIREDRVTWPEGRKAIVNGRRQTMPEYRESWYSWHGRELAWYDGKDDVLYLRTDLLAPGGGRDYMRRMAEGMCRQGFADLAELLGIDADTRLSEYTSM